MVSEATWQRRGSEAECADRAAATRGGYALSRAPSVVRDALAECFEGDLAGLDEADREVALDALVEGYLHGG